MTRTKTRSSRLWRGALAALLVTLVASLTVAVQPARARADTGALSGGLTLQQRAVLYGIARDTWNFYSTDVDPNTHLPLDNVGPDGTRGAYTSAANIGVYLWAVVAAHDLGFIGRRQATAQIAATLTTVSHLKRFNGFLYQWYDTTNGNVITNTNNTAGSNCATDTTPTFNDLCFQISQVDNGWYASGLIVVRQALPELRWLVDSLMAPMNFGIFYDSGPETSCNVYYDPTNPSNPYNYQPTGQMYGVYFVGFPPSQNESKYYHNGAFYSDPRISAYIGMGLHQMPGNVWWRSWRTLPPKAPYDNCQATDPDFSWQGQWPVAGYWQDYRDPQSGQTFHVWEGHYTYPGTSLTFIPTWAGGMFEGLMANLVVPETSWGPHSFGLADLRWAQVQVQYATQELHYPVWGLSPSSTPDDTGNYEAYGATGLVWPYNAKQGLSQCYDCNGPDMESTVTPHASFIALDVLPQQAYANIQALRQLYPDIYRSDGGFYDAVNPTTKQVGHRDLVLDQSMIMAALDNALNDHAIQRYFARDPVSWAAHLYLSYERMSIQ